MINFSRCSLVYCIVMDMINAIFFFVPILYSSLRWSAKELKSKAKIEVDKTNRTRIELTKHSIDTRYIPCPINLIDDFTYCSIMSSIKLSHVFVTIIILFIILKHHYI